SRPVRLLELVAVRAERDPGEEKPFCTEDGRVGATCRNSTLLDVPSEMMRGEEQLLRNPAMFAGLHADHAAHEQALRRVADVPFQKWMQARAAFFQAVCDWSSRVIPDAGATRPTMYVVDLRNADLCGRAREYVTSYATLLQAVTAATDRTANPALIEPVLLCDNISSHTDSLLLAPTHPAAVALLATIQRGLLSAPPRDKDDRRSIEELC